MCEVCGRTPINLRRQLTARVIHVDVVGLVRVGTMGVAFFVRSTSGGTRLGARVGAHVKVLELTPTGVEGGLKMNMNLLKSFLANERGTETVEWGLMAGLIVGGLVVTVAAIGTWVRDKFNQLNTELQAT